MDETDDDMLWNGNEEDGYVRSQSEESTDWYREVESDMLCVFRVRLIVNFFWHTFYFLGDCLRFKSSCIWVNMLHRLKLFILLLKSLLC